MRICLKDKQANNSIPIDFLPDKICHNIGFMYLKREFIFDHFLILLEVATQWN